MLCGIGMMVLILKAYKFEFREHMGEKIYLTEWIYIDIHERITIGSNFYETVKHLPERNLWLYETKCL